MLQNEEVQMTMIEKMARAIAEAEDDGLEPWQSHVETARAALEAIREPDRNVLSAMDAESYPDSGSYSRWQAAIDAILSEKA